MGGDIISDLSDHFSQFCITCLDTGVNNNHYQSKLSRDYSNFSKTKFNNEIAQLDLSTIISRTNELNKFFYKHAPLKPVSKRKIKRLSKPWITRGLRKSIKIKNALFYSGLYEYYRSLYKYYRNKITILTLTGMSKKAYYTKYFEDNLSNTKKTWEGINNLINRKRKDSKRMLFDALKETH